LNKTKQNKWEYNVQEMDIIIIIAKGEAKGNVVISASYYSILEEKR